MEREVACQLWCSAPDAKVKYSTYIGSILQNVRALILLNRARSLLITNYGNSPFEKYS